MTVNDPPAHGLINDGTDTPLKSDEHTLIRDITCSRRVGVEAADEPLVVVQVGFVPLGVVAHRLFVIWPSSLTFLYDAHSSVRAKMFQVLAGLLVPDLLAGHAHVGVSSALAIPSPRAGSVGVIRWRDRSGPDPHVGVHGVGALDLLVAFSPMRPRRRHLPHGGAVVCPGLAAARWSCATSPVHPSHSARFPLLRSLVRRDTTDCLD